MALSNKTDPVALQKLKDKVNKENQIGNNVITSRGANNSASKISTKTDPETLERLRQKVAQDSAEMDKVNTMQSVTESQGTAETEAEYLSSLKGGTSNVTKDYIFSDYVPNIHFTQLDDYNMMRKYDPSLPVFGGYEYFKKREKELAPSMEEIGKDTERTLDEYQNMAKTYREKGAAAFPDEYTLELAREKYLKFDYYDAVIEEYRNIHKYLTEFENNGVHMNEKGEVDYKAGKKQAEDRARRIELLLTADALTNDEWIEYQTGQNTQKYEENKKISDKLFVELDKADAYEYYGENKDKQYDDNLWGITSGNIKLGAIEEKSSSAGSISFSHKSNDIVASDVYDLLAERIRRNNEKTFDTSQYSELESNVALISGYLPQAFGQFKAKLGGQLAGAGVSYLSNGGISLAEAVRVGGAYGEAQYMYNQTAGDVYVRLLRTSDLSVEEAYKLAQNEALATGAIEFGISYLADKLFWGEEKLTKGAGKKAVSSASEKFIKAASKAGIKEKTAKKLLNFGKGAAKLTLNSFGEGVEEYLQAGMSINADKYAKQGKVVSPLELFWKSLDFSQYTEEEKAEMRDSFKAGYTLGFFGGGIEIGKAHAVNKIANKINTLKGSKTYDENTERLLTEIETEIAAEKEKAILENDTSKIAELEQLEQEFADVRTVMTTGATEETVKRIINAESVPGIGETSVSGVVPEADVKSSGYSGMGEWVYSSIEKETGEMTDVQKQAFDSLYNFGQKGVSYSDAVALIKDNPVLSKAFDETQMRKAWNAGKTDGQILKNGGVLKNGNHRKIEKTELSRLEKLGKLFKVAIELSDVVYDVNGTEVNGSYKGGRKICVSLTADNKLLVVAGHEILHYMKAQSKDAYLEYEKAAIDTIVKEKGISEDDLVSSYAAELRKQGRDLDEPGVREEIVADWTGEIIGDEAKLSEFIKNVSNSKTINKGKIKTVFETIRKWVKDICDLFKGDKSVTPFEKAYKLLENLAIETKGKTDGEVKVTEQKNSIKHLSKGRKYVQADEQVIHSTDDNVRAYEIMGYIKNKILKGSKEVVVTLDNGEQIKITGRTAWKMGGKDKFNDKYYLVKGNASGVIDEIIATSKYNGWKESKKEHSDGFAKKGFDYRRAYFRDLDGKYYELTISVGINEDGKEAYNIGKIKEIPFPSDKSVSGSKAQKEKVSPNPNISQDKPGVNTYSTQNTEKNSAKGNILNTILENKKLKSENERLRREFERTAFTVPDGNSIKNYAKEIKSVFSSKLNRVEIEAMVTELYDLMANRAEYLQVQDKANEIAEKIIESSEIRNDTNYNRYKGLRDDLRKNGFTLDEVQREEFAPGELEDIRKRNMGRFLIRKEGVNIDVKYAELSNDYPEFFDYETENSTPLRLEKIAEVIESLAVVYENPFDGMMGEAKASLSNQLIDDVIRYSPKGAPTFADKMEAKLTLAEKKRVEDIQKTIEREREKREKAVERVRKQYEDKISQTDERRKKALVLNQIRNQVEKLSKRLHTANSKSHIKEHLIPAIEDFLGVCDFNLGTDPEIRDTKTIPAKKFLEKFEGVGNVFSDGADITDGEFTYVDKDISAKLKNIIEKRGEDVTIKDLTAYELDVFRNAVMNVVYIANTENRIFSEEINDTVTMLGSSVISENGGFYEGGEEIKLEGLKKAGNYFLGWDQYRPGTAFHLMGETMEKLYKSLRSGFDLKMQYLERSSDYIKDTAKKNKINLEELYNSEPIVLKTERGRTIKITKGQIMSLYLTQRQTAGKKHLLDKNGGMVIAEISKSNKKQNKMKITQKDIDKIISKLSKNEIAFAESISDFFQKDVAKWANEASMKLYGYEKFGTKDYFPLFIEKVSVQERGRVNSELKKQAKLENVSFAKLREQEASGAAIIRNIIDVYVNYTDKMTSYSYLTVPLADMQRVMGYTDGKYSVENALDGKSKGEALKYIYKFTDDLNGNVIAGSGGGGFDTLMRNYKTAAIGFKISVVLKQPTSYLRAIAVIDSKYLLGAMKEGRVDKEIIHKYAPISFWKENGFFSINAGRSMKNVLIGNTNFKEKLTDASMFLAGKADEVTWGRLWKACELEIKDKHPELRPGTDAFYKEVGKRFTEVIDETQVVDSVFHRNQMMRDTSWISKYLTIFRSDPSLTYNLLVKTVNDFKNDKKGNATRLGKTVFGTALSTIAASAVGAFIFATKSSLADFITGGDDEEEKWGEAFWDNLLSTAGGDLTSIVTGFDLAFDLVSGSTSGGFSSATARPELEGIDNFLRSSAKVIKALSEDGEETLPYAVANMLRDGASVCGIPVDGFKQALNLGLGAWKNLGLPRGGADVRYKALSLIYDKEGKKFRNGVADMAFDAYVSGDKSAYNEFMRLYKEDGLDIEKITTALKNRLKKYEEGNGAFAPSFAVSWNGVRVKLDEVEEETDPTFAEYLNGLSATQYNDYEDTFEETYNRISDEIGEARFDELSSDEDKHDEYNKLENLIMKYSKEIALNEATDGEYQFSADWIGKAEEVSALVDMSVGEYIYYRAEYGTKLDSNRAMKALKSGYTPEEYMELNDRYNALKGTGKKARFLNELRAEGFSEREIQTIDYIFTTNTK